MCPWIKSLLQSERHYKRAIWGLEDHMLSLVIAHWWQVTELRCKLPSWVHLNHTAAAITAHTGITAESLYHTQRNILKQRPGVSLPRDFHVQSVLYVMVWGVRQWWTTVRRCGCGQSHLNRSLSLSMQLYQVCHSAQIITGREHREFQNTSLLYQWVQIQRLYNINRNLRKDLATQYHSPTSDVHI